MTSNPPASRGCKPIDPALGLHEILESVRQRRYMKDHCEMLCKNLPAILEITHNAAPLRSRSKGPIYKLHREEKIDPLVEERLLEKRIWQAWNTTTAASGGPFLDGVCHRIQTYQMPLKHERHDKRWGMIDLVGVTPAGLPVVIELKQDNASDTPLRALVEGLAYACAIKRAWNEKDFLREEWAAAMEKIGLHPPLKEKLSTVPVILLAPSAYWERTIGSLEVPSAGKVPADAWQAFKTLVNACEDHGYPVHCAQLTTEEAHEVNIRPVSVGPVTLP